MLSFTTCHQISVKQNMIYVKKNINSRLDYSVCRKGPKRWSLMQFRVGPQLNFYKSLILASILFRLPTHVPGSTAASGLAPAQVPGQTQPSQATSKSSWATSAPEWICMEWKRYTCIKCTTSSFSVPLDLSSLPIQVPLFLWLFTIHSSKPKAQKCKLAEEWVSPSTGDFIQEGKSFDKGK